MDERSDEGLSRIRPEDMHGFVDFVRRLQTPYYEEARQYFGKARKLEGAHEAVAYYPDQLEAIAKKHSVY